MSLKSISEVIASQTLRGGGRARVKATDFKMTFNSNKRYKKIAVCLGSYWMGKAHFIAGDRVEIFFDMEDGIGLIRRDQNGAYKLSDSKSSDKGRAYFSFTWKEGIPKVKRDSMVSGIKVNGEGIWFDWPKAE